LVDLIVYDVNGHRARFERYAADMLYVIASGNKLDTDKAERFGIVLEDFYRSPFSHKTGKLKTAADIKAYLLQKIDETRERLEVKSDESDDP